MHRPVLLVDLLAGEARVPLPEVEGPRGGHGHEGVEDEPVAQRPGQDDARRHGEEQRRAARAPRAPPGEPEGGDGQEVEHRLAGEDREPPQQARGEGGARRASRVGGEEPLHGPPQQHREDGLRPEVRREPDELGVEGRDRGGDESRPLAEGAPPDEAEGRDEERPGEALRVLDRLQGAEEGEGDTHEVQVERRVEDEAQLQGREGHVGRGKDLGAPGDPHRLVGLRGRGGLESDPQEPRRQPGQGQGQQASAERAGHAGDHSTLPSPERKARFAGARGPC